MSNVHIILMWMAIAGCLILSLVALAKTKKPKKCPFMDALTIVNPGIETIQACEPPVVNEQIAPDSQLDPEVHVTPGTRKINSKTL